ncbi:rhodanese-like domain-containing protein [Cognatiluteimonas weifangensis]|uniref:Rhodanese-like domain-containing protein n=1 Tax=Cognatiluteimonas weifangensis TaxID=2303539 RepID=A0A372DRJ6_9GAMM|nr:rhodanese-like domain-containing protein [Luteimonas weifangensis]RFP62124.1 rhodanese-like domain-containing protein [Luteimonas weifangensis]
MPVTAADLVAQARARIREIAPQALHAQPQPSVLIDVREPAEFQTGHLAGAVNIPRGVLEFQVEAHPAVANVSDPALAHKTQAIVLYCRTGGRAALAALSLQQMGFTQACSLAGGIDGWIAAGLPVTQR